MSYYRIVGYEIYYFTIFIYSFDYGCKCYYNTYDVKNVWLYNYDKPTHHLRVKDNVNLDKLKYHKHLNEVIKFQFERQKRLDEEVLEKLKKLNGH